MLLCAWTVFPSSTSGIWQQKYYIFLKRSGIGNRSRNETQRIHTNANTTTKIHSNREVDALSKVDHFVTSAKLSHFEAQLCIFEDNEAVVKVIVKGRSPVLAELR